VIRAEADGVQARVRHAFLEENAHGRLGATLADGDVSFAITLVVGVPFDEHESAGVLEDPAHVVLHSLGAVPADVGAAGVEEHVLEGGLLGEVVEALGDRRGRLRGGRARCHRLSRRPRRLGRALLRGGGLTGRGGRR